MNLNLNDLNTHGFANERRKIGSSLADIDPMNIDKSVRDQTKHFLLVFFKEICFEGKIRIYRWAPEAHSRPQRNGRISAHVPRSVSEVQHQPSEVRRLIKSSCKFLIVFHVSKLVYA